MAPRSASKAKKDDVDIALANYARAREDNKKLKLTEVRELAKDWHNTYKQSKRDNQNFEKKRISCMPARTSRSGLKRGKKTTAVYSNGDIVNKGIDYSKDRDFDEEERKYLKDEIATKVKAVRDLNYDQIRYLIQYVFEDRLKNIKSGQLKSEFHNRYHALAGKSKDSIRLEGG